MGKRERKDRTCGEVLAEMGWEEMRLLSRPDHVAFPYTRACMYNLILDRGIFIYLQVKHIGPELLHGGHEYTVYNCLHLSFTHPLGSKWSGWNHEMVISIMCWCYNSF